jgi:hypothetical protein
VEDGFLPGIKMTWCGGYEESRVTNPGMACRVGNLSALAGQIDLFFCNYAFARARV